MLLKQKNQMITILWFDRWLWKRQMVVKSAKSTEYQLFATFWKSTFGKRWRTTVLGFLAPPSRLGWRENSQ